MDDVLAQPLGVQSPQQAQQEQWHREQERRSFDVIRVKNPTSKDYFVEWDHRYHKVPAESTADVPRFVATKYCRDMKDKIIHEMGQRMHDEHIAYRVKNGQPAYNNKYEENYATYMTEPYPKTNDWELAAKIYADLWVGLVMEWGKDVPTNVNPRAGEVDSVPAEVKLLQSLETKKVSNSLPVQESPAEMFTNIPPQPATPQYAPPVTPEAPFSFGSMKEELEKEVTLEERADRTSE